MAKPNKREPSIFDTGEIHACMSYKNCTQFFTHTSTVLHCSVLYAAWLIFSKLYTACLLVHSVYRALKLLSVDPQNYEDAPREGIRRILEQLTGKKHPRDEKLDTSRISSIRMGTTASWLVLCDLTNMMWHSTHVHHVAVRRTVHADA